MEATKINTIQLNQVSPRSGLEQAGFSPEQIARLESLREQYHPLREYLESDRQFEQLQFLKWRVENGQQERG